MQAEIEHEQRHQQVLQKKQRMKEQRMDRKYKFDRDHQILQIQLHNEEHERREEARKVKLAIRDYNEKSVQRIRKDMMKSQNARSEDASSRSHGKAELSAQNTFDNGSSRYQKAMIIRNNYMMKLNENKRVISQN